MGALRVLRGGRASSPGGGSEDDGEDGLAAKHVVDLRHLVHDLVHGGKGKGHHPRAHNGAEAATCSTDAGADIRFL
ncbi:MAG: hypothetical protein V3U27_01435 [Candidatus Tectomicrobia bacterium]